MSNPVAFCSNYKLEREKKNGTGNKRKIGSMFGNFQIGDAALNMLKRRKEEPVRKINTISYNKR